MKRALPAWSQAAYRSMRVRVAAEENDLEEEHAGRPDRRHAAEPRQDVLADDRLDLKEEKRPEEDRDGEEEHGARLSVRSGQTSGQRGVRTDRLEAAFVRARASESSIPAATASESVNQRISLSCAAVAAEVAVRT